jgi:hypothetical protein
VHLNWLSQSASALRAHLAPEFDDWYFTFWSALFSIIALVCVVTVAHSYATLTVRPYVSWTALALITGAILLYAGGGLTHTRSEHYDPALYAAIATQGVALLLGTALAGTFGAWAWSSTLLPLLLICVISWRGRESASEFFATPDPHLTPAMPTATVTPIHRPRHERRSSFPVRHDHGARKPHPRQRR